LGHTPFGHSGEDALNELMAKYGGFNHNLHGLRVVDILEARYPDFPGLNLTWEVREGIVKHSSKFDQLVKIKGLAPEEMPTLETQVVDIADEIAYDNHDLDDGLTSGMLKESNLEKIPLWQNISKEVLRNYAKIEQEKRKYLIIRKLIDLQVTDIIQQTEKRINKLKLKSPEQVKKMDIKIVGFSDALQKLRRPLRDFLMDNLYQHYRVMRMSNKATRFIQELFKTYVDNPRQLPVNIQKNIPRDGLRRVVCDYIAGMTDRYALDEYKKLFDPYEKV
jgi:dGTPase